MRIRPETSLSRFYDLLTRGHALTQEEAADRLGLTSTRQIRRLIKQLREDGVEVQERRRGRRKEFFLAPHDQEAEGVPVSLTERQTFALAVAVHFAGGAFQSTPLVEPLEEASEILIDQLKDHVFTFEPEDTPLHWHFRAAPAIEVEPEMFWTLCRAIGERQSVRIDYYSASSQRRSENRKIDPLLVAVRDGIWLVVAYCHERKGVRDFSLASIDRLTLCDPGEEQAYFTEPEGFDPELHFRDRFSSLTGDEVFVVRLLVEPGPASHFLRKQYHPTQQMEEEQEDGRLVVSYEVAGLEEITSFVRSWGPGVTVLEPPELVERIAGEARALAERYQQPVAQ